MPAERSGYTVTMFVIDVSSSMDRMCQVELSDGRTVDISSLDWALKYVKLKVQDMIYRGLKTDKCGIIVFGSQKTNNIINEAREGEYEHIDEYMDIHQPDARTLAKIDKLRPSDDSETSVDPMDALIVAIQTQADFLGTKKTWTRRIILITDGETPMELEDWHLTTDKLVQDQVHTVIIGVNFDEMDEDGFKEQDKSTIKEANEEFWREFEARLNEDDRELGMLGPLHVALASLSTPDTKRTKSTLTASFLRLGDVDTRPEEALEIAIKTGKCTALARPKAFKKFALHRDMRPLDEDGKEMEPNLPDVKGPNVYVPLSSESHYYVKDEKDEDDEGGDIKKEVTQEELLLQVPSESQARQRGMDEEEDEEEDKKPEPPKHDGREEVSKEELVRGYKYGSTFVPAPDNLFDPLPTKPGMSIIGFFDSAHFRREYSMGETYFVYADPGQASSQVAFSSILRAMRNHVGKDGHSPLMAIVRWVKRGFRDRVGGDPIMGVLAPCDAEEDEVDFFMFMQMPFADDVRKYTFPSLEMLVSKSGEVLEKHPYLPTETQLDAMDTFVDAMDLMTADEDDDGNPKPWFEPNESYNPAIHRIKQAMLHTGVVEDITADPCPPPNPELLKFFEPPEDMVEAAESALEGVRTALNVRAVPKRVAKARGDGHHHAADDSEDADMLLEDKEWTVRKRSSPSKKTQLANNDDEDEEQAEVPEQDVEMAPPLVQEERLLATPPPPLGPKSSRSNPLPTPARSISPPGDDGAMNIDRGVAPGRIIGTTYPLEDFKKNLSQGDVVSKAVEDMGDIITEIVLGKFPHKRHGEMVECMKAMRDTCLNEDEIVAWNDFLRELKDKCTEDDPGNVDFWDTVRQVGVSLSLIGSTEASKVGGKSKIPDARARKFIE
ncbi:ku80-like protein [Flagelloscypha sp. PMI_526]|nr:ku80-like protein [Flagelloscypha sp. PMI_526]